MSYDWGTMKLLYWLGGSLTLMGIFLSPSLSLADIASSTHSPNLNPIPYADSFSLSLSGTESLSACGGTAAVYGYYVYFPSFPSSRSVFASGTLALASSSWSFGPGDLHGAAGVPGGIEVRAYYWVNPADFDNLSVPCDTLIGDSFTIDQPPPFSGVFASTPSKYVYALGEPVTWTLTSTSSWQVIDGEFTTIASCARFFYDFSNTTGLHEGGPADANTTFSRRQFGAVMHRPASSSDQFILTATDTMPFTFSYIQNIQVYLWGTDHESSCDEGGANLGPADGAIGVASSSLEQKYALFFVDGPAIAQLGSTTIETSPDPNTTYTVVALLFLAGLGLFDLLRRMFILPDKKR
jgi:hypothetical protein